MLVAGDASHCQRSLHTSPSSSPEPVAASPASAPGTARLSARSRGTGGRPLSALSQARVLPFFWCHPIARRPPALIPLPLSTRGSTKAQSPSELCVCLKYRQRLSEEPWWVGCCCSWGMTWVVLSRSSKYRLRVVPPGSVIASSPVSCS